MKTFLQTAKTFTGAITAGLMFGVLTATAAENSNEVSLSHVQPYSASFEYFVVDDDGLPLKAGSWTDKVRIRDGLLSREVRRYTNEGEIDLLRTVVVEQASVRPVRVQQRYGTALENVFHIEFDESAMTQILIGNAAAPARISTTDLGQPVVEAGLNAVFALSLSMESAGRITVDSYAPGAQPQIVEKTFHIVGQEDVDAMKGELTTWRIEDRATQWTYWVRPEAPYVVKVVHPLPDGRMATSLVTEFKLEDI